MIDFTIVVVFKCLFDFKSMWPLSACNNKQNVSLKRS